MALPYIQLPSSFPGFRLAGHTVSPVDPYAWVPMSTGGGIKRRVYTTTPREVAVTARLTPSQAADFDDWYERVLLAGVRDFAVLLPGTEVFRVGAAAPAWWAARFVGGRSVVTDPEAGHYWQLSARLRLTGEPSGTAPSALPLEAGMQVALRSDIDILYRLPLSGAMGVTLTGSV